MNDQEQEIKARDKQSDNYDMWYLQKGMLHDWVEKKVVIDALNVRREDVILDVGCGTGRFTTDIAKKCKKVYGVDFSPKSVEVLNKKLLEQEIRNVETFVGDITKPLPIKELVDKIVSVEVIQHIPTEAGRHRALDNLYAQLKVGGICVIIVYNYGSLFDHGLLKEGKFSSGIYYLRFTPKEAEVLLKECGFGQVSVRGCVNFRWYARLNICNLHRLFYPVAGLDTFLSKFKTSCFLGTYLIVKGSK